MNPSNQKIKLAAFDFDGTILFENGISNSTAIAINNWQQAGHLAVASTGKSLSAAKFALEGTGISFDYSVLFTGAAITDKQGKVLYSSSLNSEVVRDIIIPLQKVSNIAVYGTRLKDRDVRFSSTIHPDHKTTILRDFQEIDIQDLNAYQFIGIPIWVPNNRSLQSEIHQWISDSFEVECVINQDFIDVLPAGSTKGNGLNWLSKHLSIARSSLEIFTFGDSWNDLSMHSIADRSYSFPWSPTEIQTSTDETINSVEEALRNFY